MKHTDFPSSAAWRGSWKSGNSRLLTPPKRDSCSWRCSLWFYQKSTFCLSTLSETGSSVLHRCRATHVWLPHSSSVGSGVERRIILGLKVILAQDARVFRPWCGSPRRLYDPERWVRKESALEIGDAVEMIYDHQVQFAYPFLFEGDTWYLLARQTRFSFLSRLRLRFRGLFKKWIYPRKLGRVSRLGRVSKLGWPPTQRTKSFSERGGLLLLRVEGDLNIL